MATSAFKSTTKRTSVGGADDDRGSYTKSSGGCHRARSVSRFSHRLPSESTELVQEKSTPLQSTRRKFVNTVRGTALPEISLDDLAIELFSSGERGRCSEASSSGTAASQRGRSVSRKSSSRVTGERSVVGGRRVGGGSGNAAAGGRLGADRRRRSLSVVRYRASDSESDHSEKYSHGNANICTSRIKQKATLHEQLASTQQRVLRRCSSQRDFMRLHDGSSSQSYSSALTDDESWDARYGSDGFENLQSVYTRNEPDHLIGNGITNDQFEATQKKHTHTVQEIRRGLEQVRLNENLSGLVNGGGLQPKGSDILQAVSTVRRSYSAELEQSEKCKQELFAKIMLEEQCGKELKRIVGELLLDPKETYPSQRPSCSRKRSNDRQRISRKMNEDAEKIIEDFISSVEDNTDISSFDGEKSDTSSTFGVAMRPRNGLMHFGEAESYRTPPKFDCLPVEMDGVVLPWLLWETSNDNSPQYEDKEPIAAVPNTVFQNALEGMDAADEQKQSIHSNSSRGSWSPALAQSFSVDLEEVSRITKPLEPRKSRLLASFPRRSRVDMDDYLARRSNEEFLFERWKQGNKISSGGMLLCEGSWGPILL